MSNQETHNESSDTSSSRFPRFLLILVFVEMWERFSFYSMKNLMVLYLTKELKLRDDEAYALHSMFQTIGYIIPVFTGIIADRWFGFRIMVLIGGIIIALGHLSMFLGVFYKFFFLLGISTISIGTGLFKGNINNLLGASYDKKGNEFRINGFTLFYAAINLGSFLSSFASGYLSVYAGYHYAFGMAGVGMLISLIIFFFNKNLFIKLDTSPKFPLFNKKLFLKLGYTEALFLLSIVFSFPLCYFLKISYIFTKFNVLYLAVPLVIALAVIIYTINDERERKNLCILLIYLIFFMIFFVFELQLGSLFILFIDRNVHQYIFGIHVPAAVSSAINPAFIMIYGFIYGTISRHNDKYDPFKVTFALFSNSLCFLILYWGCNNADSSGRTSYIYPFFGIIIMAIGEVMISPMIQAHATYYSPKSMKGFMMGVTMAVLGFASFTGFFFANMFNVPHEEEINPLTSLEIYQKGFFEIFLYNLIPVLLFVLCIPVLIWLKKPSTREIAKNKELEGYSILQDE